MQGNDKYKCKENASALRLYTESIICAPEFGPELSLGFGNRFCYYCTGYYSFVTLVLLHREYHLCSGVWTRAQPGLWQQVLLLLHWFLLLCHISTPVSTPRVSSVLRVWTRAQPGLWQEVLLLLHWFLLLCKC